MQSLVSLHPLLFYHKPRGAIGEREREEVTRKETWRENIRAERKRLLGGQMPGRMMRLVVFGANLFNCVEGFCGICMCVCVFNILLCVQVCVLCVNVRLTHCVFCMCVCACVCTRACTRVHVCVPLWSTPPTAFPFTLGYPRC